jgi:hypothetical protein
VAANGQFTWPSAVSFVTVSGQDLMAADKPHCNPNNELRE